MSVPIILLMAVTILLGVVALYFLISRPVRNRHRTGRSDVIERSELTGRKSTSTGNRSSREAQEFYVD